MSENTTPNTLAIIPCGAAKADEPAPAFHLYTGPMFRHTNAAALAVTDGDAGIGYQRGTNRCVTEPLPTTATLFD